ncbi:hypothetical protein O7627_25725 [Solwaraspora sp. WMMD1047]|uniref:hypothetical protein n=1 Tax=Solwaraspora sp. WMMD1047 TaxID=3016102 RepID=UPI002416C0C7|nr:hypothetical protein [Solwaraspora sp. WMMD1047]MDG4832682.1 hypothetical protein [Solwaraspora sp. WMMD1047]
MTSQHRNPVWIQTVEVGGRHIGWDVPAGAPVDDRLGDIRTGVDTVARLVADAVLAMPAAGDWEADEVRASFSVTPVSGGGVLLSHGRDRPAAVGVRVTYRRRG